MGGGRGGGGGGGFRSVFTRAFLGKKRTSMYISREEGDHYYIQTRRNDIFFAITMFSLGKLKKKLARKARVNTERVYRIALVPPRHPIMILKSNEFNMAAVSVKRSIRIRADPNNLDRLK